MAKKRERAFFVCPRWQQIVDANKQTGGQAIVIDLSPKTSSAIENGRPVARSTLRKALFAVRRASGSMFDVDDLIIDERRARPRG